MSGRRTPSSSDKDQFISRYRRLSEQSESIQQRIGSISSVHSYDSISTMDSRPSTPSPKKAQSYPYRTTSSYPMASSWSQSPSAETSNHSTDMAGHASLYEINQQIKSTLTELLNCDGVRHDKIFRAWVQTRLMEAEHQLKKQRRRRSSISPETMKTFEHSLGGDATPASGLTWRSSF
ncbi:Acyl-CoA synthetase short-chain family member 3 [Venturia nashicola]|uniref:Acyl-CoA synthetase short-chain family member 3 n=1 Tax=Venturia nashicola TaxID=86259 RepID=A0A4Z1P1J5_9PEZI|nr:Acyl-CoA synthetase short-chain family member 3 [Venturia nashicola]